MRHNVRIVFMLSTSIILVAKVILNKEQSYYRSDKKYKRYKGTGVDKIIVIFLILKIRVFM